MKHTSLFATMLTAAAMAAAQFAWAGQAPGALADADVPVSHHDRRKGDESRDRSIRRSHCAAQRPSSGRTSKLGAKALLP